MESLLTFREWIPALIAATVFLTPCWVLSRSLRKVVHPHPDHGWVPQCELETQSNLLCQRHLSLTCTAYLFLSFLSFFVQSWNLYTVSTLFFLGSLGFQYGISKSFQRNWGIQLQVYKRLQNELRGPFLILGIFMGLALSSIIVFSLLLSVTYLLNPPQEWVGVLIAASFLGNLLIQAYLMFGLAPRFLKWSFQGKPLSSFKLTQSLTLQFKQAKVPCPEFLQIRLGKRVANAWVSGFMNGKTWFRPALFLSEGLIEKLQMNELQAVVSHEIAHLKLNHLRQRFLRISLSLIPLFLVAFAINAVMIFFLKDLIFFSIPISMVAVAITQNWMISRVLQKQEFEADRHAVEQLGTSPQDLISALQKIHQGAPAKNRLFQTHPAVEDRIQALQVTESSEKKAA